MHPKTVSQVYNVVKDRNFERKSDLMDIFLMIGNLETLVMLIRTIIIFGKIKEAQ